MKNIDKRKTYLLTLDVETCNMVDDNQLPYNIGLIVHDKYANVYEKYNIVISEIYYDMKDLMFNSNYYANKLPKYEKAIANGEMVVLSMWQLYQLMKDLCNDYNIKAIIAHNARFDYRALNNLIRYITKSQYRYFTPKNVEIWDSMYMAKDTIAKQKLYIAWCKENNYMTKFNTPQTKAEVLYKYIAFEDNFEEEHIGLQDCEIEMQITCKCLAQHKPMRKRLYEPKHAKKGE